MRKRRRRLRRRRRRRRRLDSVSSLAWGFLLWGRKEKMLSEENEDGDEQRNRERYDLSQLHRYPTITYT
jgi:hypothetical protein